MLNQLKNYVNWDAVLPIIGTLIAAVILMCTIGTSEPEADTASATTTQNTTKETTTEPPTKETTTEATTTQPVTTQPEETTTLNPASLINFSAQFPYYIKVNRAANCVTVYGLDYDGEYSIPYKSFVCSTGNPIDYTPMGTFSISDKYDWRLMVDGSYAQYAVRISGQIMFHSVGYYSMDKGDLKYEEYNKLGENASLGCIRLTCEDAKWIHDNCPAGTQVEIYDNKDNPGPLGKPEAFKIPKDSLSRGWDPTDDDKNNPWKQ